MRFKIFGTTVSVTFPFSATVVALLLTDRTGFAFFLLLSAAAHETAHLAAMWMLDCSPKQVNLNCAAVEIVSPPVTSAKEEMLITLAGPLANGLLFLTFWLNFQLFRSESALLFSSVNALIGAFNLLPVKGLDGGTLLLLLLTRLFGEEKAKRTLRILGLILAATAVFAGVFLLKRGIFNPTVLLSGLYILVMTLIKM